MRQRRKVEPGSFWKGLAKKVTLTGDTGWQTISTSSFGKLLSDNDDSALLKAFSLSEIVFACVREKATAVNDAPLEVVRDTEDGVEVVDHEALSLFYDNKYYSYADLLNLMVSRLELTGASRCLMNLYRNRDGVGEIIPLPSNIVKANSNAVQIVGYEITRDGDSPLVVDLEEILDIRYVDPASFMGYISPLSAAYRQYRTDEQREILTNELLENRQVPGLMLEQQAGQALTRDQVAVLRDTLTERVGGGKRGKSLVIPFGLKVAPGIDVKDIDFSALASLTESRICMAFQVPPILIGAKVGLDKATYANYKEARKSFYRESMKAIWNILAEGFTRNIFRKHGEEELYFRFDTSNVPEMQEDEDAKANRVVALFNAGVIDRNEARQEVGYDPTDEEYTPSVTEPTPQDEAPVDETKPEEQLNDMEEQKEELAGKARAAIGYYPQERALEKAIAEEFRRQSAACVAYIKDGKDINFTEVGSNMGVAVKPYLQKIYESRAKETIDEIIRQGKTIDGFKAKADDLSIDFNVVNEHLQQAIDNQIVKLSESTIAFTEASIAATVSKVRSALTEAGVLGANTIPEITKAVQEAFGGMETWRAKRIAITESSRAVHSASVISAYESNVVKAIVPIISADACQLCQAYDANNNPTGQPLFPMTSIQDALSQIDDYENRTLPPFHPNCRCTVGYVFIDGPQVNMPQQVPQVGTQVR